MNDIKVIENSLIDEKYYFVKHKSGLGIYLVPKKLSTSYAVFSTNYGSVDNRFRKLSDGDYTVVPDGIAHFLEHKMFENEDGIDSFEKFAEFGGNANAYTSFDMTSYLFSCTDHFEENLRVLLTFVTHPYFTKETVEKEQGIIAQEIRMGEDNPGRALLFGALKSMYEKNNVRIEIAGTVDSISKINADLLYSSYNTFYNLNNMALCIAGDVDINDVIRIADEILPVSEPFEIESVNEPEGESVVREYYKKEMQVAKPIFAISVKNSDISSDPRERMKQMAALSLICEMIFGKGSDFFNEYYNNGKLTCDFDPWEELNKNYSFIIAASESDNPTEIYDAFKEYVKKFKKDGFDRAQFDRIKKVSYAAYVEKFDSTSDIANSFLGYIFDGSDMFEYPGVLAEIDYDYMFDYFNKVFSEDRFCLTEIVPISEK